MCRGRVVDEVDLIVLPQGVERREGHPRLGPERTEEQLAPAGGAHGRHEVGVLPGS
jgi:hypothetical protein